MAGIRKYCLTPRCPDEAIKGSAYCASCRKKRGYEKEKARGTRHERGYGVKWVKLRKKILVRDHYMCQVCKQAGIVTPATEVDHRIPKSRGGSDDPSNLQSICQRCHAEKTAKER